MLLYVCSVILGLFSLYVSFETKKTYDRGKSLSLRLSLGWWIIDTVHASLVILSSLYTVWPIPINVIAALTGGSIILGAGMSIMLAGIIKFRSLRKISGLDTSGLVTTGIYQWSRNPQFFGWFLALIGISLIGRSEFSFLLTVLAIISYHYYITRIEEPYLERIFGEKYLLYKSRTPRYFRIRGKE